MNVLRDDKRFSVVIDELALQRDEAQRVRRQGENLANGQQTLSMYFTNLVAERGLLAGPRRLEPRVSNATSASDGN